MSSTAPAPAASATFWYALIPDDAMRRQGVVIEHSDPVLAAAAPAAA